MNKEKVTMLVKGILLFVIVVITTVTIIYTPEKFRANQPLQQIGTALLMVPLLYDIVKNRMPLSAFVGISLAIVIHVIGAQYSYSNVPHMEWCRWLELWAQKPRNNYDRIVHLSFGALLFPFLYHMSHKWLGEKKLAAILMAWLLVQAGSIIYEIFEWQLSVWMDPSAAEGYNGQQGDVWDAQKDMALAMIGSTIMALFYAAKGNIELERIRALHIKGETK